MSDNQLHNRGSEWRKWDLHVHTPFSHTSEYIGATEEEKWENFITGLESLPSDIKVIGVNDYLFLDGYEKVLRFKDSGRLQNIELILPVVEFRLKEFVGSNDQLKKINYHVIFAEQEILSLETINAQFLSCFRATCNLDETVVDVATWGGVVTRESLIDLGKHIYDHTPEDKRESDNHFEIGFNNISYSLDKLKECLGEIKEPNTYLKSKYIKAIGKSEWEDFRWTGSPADKKSIINNAHIVFSASPSTEQANKNIESLKSQSVNGRLLHCSDAHTIKHEEVEGVANICFSNTNPKDLGHCFTWIKGGVSFETLRQVVVDYENRVLLQERNPSQDKNSSPELFIDRIEYKQDQEAEIQTVRFNQDMNSIIGKRGSGKSVLLKHIAFDTLGERENPIVKNIQKLQDFKVYWCDKTSDNKFVEYIPQNYLSTITYEDGDDYPKRDEMLKERLFNSELFKNADTSKNEAIDSIELKINAKVKDLLSSHRQVVDTKNQLKPLGKTEDKDSAINTKQEEIKKLGKVNITDEDIKNQTEYSSKIESLSGEIKLLEQDVQIIRSINEDVSFITVDDEAFFGLSQTTLELIEKHIEKLSSKEIKDYLNSLRTDLVAKIKSKKETNSEFEKKLVPINEKLQQNKTIEKILKEVGVLNGERKEIEKLNIFIQATSEKIVELTSELADLYLSFKNRIEGIVQTLTDVSNDFTFITFDFKVEYDVGVYKKRFFDMYIDARSGNRFKVFMDEKRDFDHGELVKIIEDIITDADTAKLKTAGGDKESALITLLSCRYDIDFTKSVKYKNGEVSVDFENMTGGQKAMALLDLIFTLSKSRYPIIIDQPENDIDVSGISDDLKKLLLSQKEKRQVIVATHSPNLLLLTDSENVIVAENDENTIKYHNGGIEDRQIQDDIVTILEGGGDALKKRMQKLNIS